MSKKKNQNTFNNITLAQAYALGELGDSIILDGDNQTFTYECKCLSCGEVFENKKNISFYCNNCK